MNMSHSDSTHTSLAKLFTESIGGTQVQAIEIPKIQRDYAQGRENQQVQQIRGRFIDDLFKALDNYEEEGIDLDFVFGDVVEKNQDGEKVSTLYPLDGQQRLTTLFLLHCYLAWHIPETKGVKQPWHAFSYTTRPGAREFCEFLTTSRPNLDEGKVSAWLKDQPQYLPTWKHDPTIQGMLVMLDELHARYRQSTKEQCRKHWERLTDLTRPAIRFHLLPIKNDSENNDLYVKMNSRGKPLTEFENFKAELEALLRSNRAIAGDTLRNFSHRIDTDWADLFWQYRGVDDLIDEQFMRYLRFVAEVWAWKQGIDVKHQSTHDAQQLVRLAKAFFSTESDKSIHAQDSLNWMTKALGIWLEDTSGRPQKPSEIKSRFEELFTRTDTAAVPLRVFNFRDFDEQKIGVDMFHACCNLYGTRSWRLAHTLLLYGVLRGLMDKVPLQDLSHRLRLLRNLIEASQDEIRAGERNKMPELLAEVETIMARGSLDGIKAFNQVQVGNELAKQAFLEKHPSQREALHRLEDHELLRGGLTVFDLNPERDSGTFADRVEQFAVLFAKPYNDVTGALLALEHEGRIEQPKNDGYRLAYLGAPENQEPWRNLFRARKEEAATGHPSRDSLMALLDRRDELATVMNQFTSASSTRKDWRYYMVKYPAMRKGDSGRHVIGPGKGYAMCMLKGDFCDNRSYHYDSYLFALAELAEVSDDRIGNDNKWPRCFSGDGTQKRQLELRNSGLKIQCVDAGWEFSNFPENAQQREAFDAVMQGYPCWKSPLYVVPQNDGIDTEDRIDLGARVLRCLVDKGL